MKEAIVRLNEVIDKEYDGAPAVCILATSDSTGRPSARCMVLRQANDTGGLLFVSDRRTNKDQDLRERPACEVVFWLPKSNVQARIRGLAVIVDAMNDQHMRSGWWHQLDSRAVKIFSGGKGTDPESTPMPSTFELITVTPTWVEVGDYSTTPSRIQRWGE